MSTARKLEKEITQGFATIEKLNATNWWAWKHRVQRLFKLHKYIDYIDETRR